MNIEIIEPFFKCEADKDVFFSRLFDLTGYVSVVGRGFNLTLNLNVGSADAVDDDLKAICSMWNTTFKYLD